MRPLPPFFDELLRAARRHPGHFSSTELASLESWIEATRSEPDAEEIADWLQTAAAAAVLNAKKGVV